MTKSNPLHGLRILVVEDVYLVAEVICDQLQDCGCEVVGPVGQLNQALALARQETLDGAVLDVNLKGQPSFAVSDALRERMIPYVFLTGYDSPNMFPPEYRDAPRLGKPFRHADFVAFMTRHLDRRAQD
jgi:CheY-like chemotaxis protein